MKNYPELDECKDKLFELVDCLEEIKNLINRFEEILSNMSVDIKFKSSFIKDVKTELNNLEEKIDILRKAFKTYEETLEDDSESISENLEAILDDLLLLFKGRRTEDFDGILKAATSILEEIKVKE